MLRHGDACRSLLDAAPLQSHAQRVQSTRLESLEESPDSPPNEDAASESSLTIDASRAARSSDSPRATMSPLGRSIVTALEAELDQVRLRD